MKTEEVMTVNREREVRVLSGWLMLPVAIGLLLGGIALLIYSIVSGVRELNHPQWALFVPAIVMELAGVISMPGFFTLQPNEARVLILFGAYKGTVRQSGFHWGNPFYANAGRQTGFVTGLQGQGTAGGEGKPSLAMQRTFSRCKISLRARTLNGERLKVNDKRGNPIEIGAIVIWRVKDTAQAAFDVDEYEKYVHTQSESALRHLASCYPYDHGEENETTLRSGVDEVSQALRAELQERLAKAGVVVEEARLTHLAYAPEIAQAMLRRQQAEAVIAARQKIVAGAVSNLMVVLCGESEVHPVVNTGTLYT